MSKRILITGGAGFIGSAVVRYIIHNTQDYVVNVDKLTYAGNLESLEAVVNNARYTFEQVDICDHKELARIFTQYQPDAVMHLAAESHVDRSINGPAAFIETNIVGTYTLLEVTKNYWNNLDLARKAAFRFHHISTDEVFGDLVDSHNLFTETTPYAPSSPYSASKAASDHLVRAWYRTYGLPIIITHSSNNYGYFQHQEKFIPKMILNALSGLPLPIYGDGLQIRDWLFVEDHVKALYLVLNKGKIGESYNIGSNSEKTNLSIVNLICNLLEELAPSKPHNVHHYQDLIVHIEDRLGHDRRYALDNSKIQSELDWKPEESFETGIRKTIKWYLNRYNSTL